MSCKELSWQQFYKLIENFMSSAKEEWDDRPRT